MWHSYSPFFIIVNHTDVNRCQGILMWHPHRAGFIVNHTDVNRCQGILMWHPHRAGFIVNHTDANMCQGILMWHSHSPFYYSEPYRCEQVPRITDVAPSQAFGMLLVNHMRTGAKEYLGGTLKGLCYIVNHIDADRCQGILMWHSYSPFLL